MERLDRDNFDPVLIVPAEGEMAKKARDIRCEVRVFPFPSLRSGPAVLLALLRLRRLLKTERISLIHTDDPRSAFYSLLAKFALGIPLLFHVRTEIADPLDPLFEFGADRIILTAHALAARFSNRPRTVVIYNGIDLDVTAETNVTTLPPSGPPLLICPARLHPPKGQHLLLAAVQELIIDFPSLTVWFVGEEEGEYRTMLANQAKGMGLEKSVQFLGFRPDLRSFFHLADLVVLPSLHEAFPRVLLEAMAAGRAIVATKVGGVPEAVEDGVNGLLVPPNDVRALAEAMARILGNKDRRRAMESAARSRARIFTLERTISLTESLYREYVNEKNHLL
jgi:glycosyltransferase involved in cell wall biosynthesis